MYFLAFFTARLSAAWISARHLWNSLNAAEDTDFQATAKNYSSLGGMQHRTGTKHPLELSSAEYSMANFKTFVHWCPPLMFSLSSVPSYLEQGSEMQSQTLVLLLQYLNHRPVFILICLGLICRFL